MTRLKTAFVSLLAGIAVMLALSQPPHDAQAQVPIVYADAGTAFTVVMDGNAMPVIAEAQAPAPATVAPVQAPTPDDPFVFVALALSAIQNGNWWVLASAVLSIAVLLLRMFGGERWPILAGDRAGVVLTVLGAALGAMTHGLAASYAAHVPLDWPMLGTTALKVASGSIAGYVATKKMLAPRVAT